MAKGNTSTAVSYTHLDVYKRQVWESSFSVEEWSFAGITDNTVSHLKLVLSISLVSKNFVSILERWV